jgi:two-component system, cell cycle sensor histidine kinase DivJ
VRGNVGLFAAIGDYLAINRPAAAALDAFVLSSHRLTGLVTRHGPGGAVLSASSAAGPLLQVTAADLLDQGLFERVHVADRPAFLTALADAAVDGCQSVELRMRRPRTGAGPDEFIWVEMRCEPLAHGGGEVVAVMRETGERHARQQELEDARLEAERANVAKSRFLATMSHELRTPLNAIIGFSEMLTKEELLLIGPARRREYAHLINESGHHLLAVVNGILDMSKIEAGHFEIRPESIAPEHVIADGCDMLALKAREAGVELSMELSDRLPRIHADRRAMSQIVLNLLANAIKFTDRGGRVTVSARVEDDRLAVTVEDNGVGIAADDLPRVGDPFFQARATRDRRQDGTGLGLSIVRGLLALHGGELAIDSRLGEGTRVTFRLPIDGAGGRGEGTVAQLAPRFAGASASHGASDASDGRVRKSA